MTLVDAAKKTLVATELDETAYPEFRDRIRVLETAPVQHAPRVYPGHPQIVLPRARQRPFVMLDSILARRRSRRTLGTRLPTKHELARVLHGSHGMFESDGRGPTPSSGKLSALELYLAPLVPGWLPEHVHHYGRADHRLSAVAPSGPRSEWQVDVPSLGQSEGGALLFVLVGDVARVASKYGPRAGRLLLLEAGHLMQNLCLVSESIGRCTVPLGGFFERKVACRLRLHATDAVLYLGVFG